MNQTIAVYTYSQSGQAQQMAQALCRPLLEAGCRVAFEQIVPEQAFPFPWNKNEFFSAFPETRLHTPAPIKDPNLEPMRNADLVIIAGQSWFLSPSQPIEAFLQHKGVRDALKGKAVVTLNGCRNMWAMGQKEIRRQLSDAGAKYVGFVALQDPAPNLVSLLTIMRWLIYGKKEAGALLPEAGIRSRGLLLTTKLGGILQQHLQNGTLDKLQGEWASSGSARYRSFLVMVERIGYKGFGIWARFCQKGGGPMTKGRLRRLNFFVAYIFIALLLVSPVVLVIYYLTYALRIRKIRREQEDLLFNLGRPSAKDYSDY